MDILLGGFVLLSLFLLDEKRMRQVSSWVQEFMDYLERQQQQA
jgi:hypothetical protein